jgi:hypothetical protein
MDVPFIMYMPFIHTFLYTYILDSWHGCTFHYVHTIRSRVIIYMHTRFWTFMYLSLCTYHVFTRNFHVWTWAEFITVLCNQACDLIHCHYGCILSHTVITVVYYSTLSLRLYTIAHCHYGCILSHTVTTVVYYRTCKCPACPYSACNTYVHTNGKGISKHAPACIYIYMYVYIYIYIYIFTRSNTQYVIISMCNHKK